MATKRSEQLKKILAADMAFTNVLFGILMIFFESLWMVILYDSGRMTLGQNWGWNIQWISAIVITSLTLPYLLASLFMASSMTEISRTVVGLCSVVIGGLAVIFTVGLWLEVGSALKASYAVSRLPWLLFGLLVLFRLRLFKAKAYEEKPHSERRS